MNESHMLVPDNGLLYDLRRILRAHHASAVATPYLIMYMHVEEEQSDDSMNCCMDLVLGRSTRSIQ